VKYSIIRTEEQYNKYCDRHEELADSDKLHTDEFELLELLLSDYDSKLYNKMGLDKEISPLEIIQLCMEDHKLSNNGLALKLDLPSSEIDKILYKKVVIPISVAKAIAKLFCIQEEAMLRPYFLEERL
jgi:antitoxin component HigA of HigAB toxin-antitoxin module